MKHALSDLSSLLIKAPSSYMRNVPHDSWLKEVIDFTFDTAKEECAGYTLLLSFATATPAQMKIVGLEVRDTANANNKMSCDLDVKIETTLNPVYILVPIPKLFTLSEGFAIDVIHDLDNKENNALLIGTNPKNTDYDKEGVTVIDSAVWR